MKNIEKHPVKFDNFLIKFLIFTPTVVLIGVIVYFFNYEKALNFNWKDTYLPGCIGILSCLGLIGYYVKKKLEKFSI